MLRWTLAVLIASVGVAAAAPLAPSTPSDPDLTDGVCQGHPDAASLLAALPDAVPQLVVLWPRVGRSSEPCRTVARLTFIDHAGALITASWTFGAPRDPGFRPWEEGRAGPARSELVVDPGVPGLHLVIAGPPLAGEDVLRGLAGTLSAVPLPSPLGSGAPD